VCTSYIYRYLRMNIEYGHHILYYTYIMMYYNTAHATLKKHKTRFRKRTLYYTVRSLIRPPFFPDTFLMLLLYRYLRATNVQNNRLPVVVVSHSSCISSGVDTSTYIIMYKSRFPPPLRRRSLYLSLGCVPVRRARITVRVVVFEFCSFEFKNGQISR